MLITEGLLPGVELDYFLSCLFICIYTTLYLAKTAAVIGCAVHPGPHGVKYSQMSDLSAVRSFPNTPFLDIAITVD